MELHAALGLVVREARMEKGWSLRDLGRESGIQKASLSRLERGMAQMQVGTVERLAEALDTTSSALMARAEKLRASEVHE